MAKDIPTKNTDMSAKWFIIRTWIFDLNLLRDNPLKIWKKGSGWKWMSRIKSETQYLSYEENTDEEISILTKSDFFTNSKTQKNIFQIIPDCELVSDFRDQAGLKLCSKTAFPWFSFGGQWITWNVPQNLAHFESFILVTLISYKII